MIYIKPDFYDKFKCIASACTDSCCIGWEIDIDCDTLEKYNTSQTSFGEKIRAEIINSEDGSKCFRLTENERCPFLNEKNLCDIIINCGENEICDICKEHPRFYEWFANITECGLGLSCEEVCRLLIESEKMFTLTEYNDGEKIILTAPEDTVETDTYIFLSAFRETLFDCLKDEKTPFCEKIDLIKSKTENFANEKIFLKSDDELITAYLNTEPIDEKWTEYISAISKNYRDYLKSEKEFDKKTDSDMIYSKILAYIIYRHFIKSVFDGDIAQRIAFCIESVRFIKICDIKTFCESGALTLRDRINNLKNWSKQIEYSDLNTENLIYGDDF